MKRITRAWQAWVALLDRREDPSMLAIVRIALALVVLYDFLTIWRLDLIVPLFTPPPHGFGADFHGWARDLFGAGPVRALALWYAAVLALVAIACGAFTRIACVVFVLVSAQLGHIAPTSDRGIDMIVRLAFGILAFSQSHAKWSFDAWARRLLGRPYAAEVPAWPRYLVMLQVLWIYFSSASNKTTFNWGPLGGFTALGNILADPHYSSVDPAWIWMPATQIGTLATMVFELGAPLYLALYYFAVTPDRDGRLRAFSNRYRLAWAWLVLGVGMHIGIAVTMRLGMFPWGMLAMYPALVPLPERYRRNGERPANRASSPS